MCRPFFCLCLWNLWGHPAHLRPLSTPPNYHTLYTSLPPTPPPQLVSASALRPVSTSICSRWFYVKRPAPFACHRAMVVWTRLANCHYVWSTSDRSRSPWSTRPSPAALRFVLPDLWTRSAPRVTGQPAPSLHAGHCIPPLLSHYTLSGGRTRSRPTPRRRSPF